MINKTMDILDCTLRDGGYCNEWGFNNSEIEYVISHLTLANVDYVECGYLSKYPSKGEKSIYEDMTTINRIFQKIKIKGNTQYAVMVNCGEYDVNALPMADKCRVRIVRYAFHKKDYVKAIRECSLIKEKGYDVFLQPMVTNCYSQNELEQLLTLANELLPAAVYIVDSFGSLTPENLEKIIETYERHLLSQIKVGLHTHNNLQLAFSNSILFARLVRSHNMIIDSTVMGIGRGAGNLNSELFLDWVNRNQGYAKYNLKEILKIADNVISSIAERNQWGYSLANYLSAVHNCHPNYSKALSEKRTLTYEDINRVFEMMEESKKYSFDRDYIESLYVEYLSRGDYARKIDDKLCLAFLRKKIVIIGSGRSAWSEKDKILDALNEEDTISISLNFDYSLLRTDYVFVSNLRRYEQLDKSLMPKAIVTSNIPATECFMKIDYKKYVCDIEYVHDNAMIMLVNFLITAGASAIYIAGVDGYLYSKNNYIFDNMDISISEELCDQINNGLREFIAQKKHDIDISIITEGVLI